VEAEPRAESLLAGVREAVNALFGYDASPDEVADAVADCRALEVKLTEWRWRQESHVDPNDVAPVDPGKRIEDDPYARPPAAVGKRWQLEAVGGYDRTYRLSGILQAFADELDLDTLAALRWLIRRGAVKPSIGIKGLRAAAKQAGVKLTVGKGKIDEDDGDLDAPMVMEEWKQKGFKRVPIKD
jgi:hypothetical protein